MKTRITHAGRPGIWPNGEPRSVRAAYDEWLSNQPKPAEPQPPVRVPARPGVKPR